MENNEKNNLDGLIIDCGTLGKVHVNNFNLKSLMGITGLSYVDIANELKVSVPMVSMLVANKVKGTIHSKRKIRVDFVKLMVSYCITNKLPLQNGIINIAA